MSEADNLIFRREEREKIISRNSRDNSDSASRCAALIDWSSKAQKLNCFLVSPLEA